MQVRYDKRVGEGTAIKFMTDGILLRELQEDFLLRWGWGAGGGEWVRWRGCGGLWAWGGGGCGFEAHC